MKHFYSLIWTLLIFLGVANLKIQDFLVQHSLVGIWQDKKTKQNRPIWSGLAGAVNDPQTQYKNTFHPFSLTPLPLLMVKGVAGEKETLHCVQVYLGYYVYIMFFQNCSASPGVVQFTMILRFIRYILPVLQSPDKVTSVVCPEMHFCIL